MFAILGDIEFELAHGITAMEHTAAAQFAQHDRIGVLPALQFTGHALQELNITLQLHATRSDPTAAVARLRAAMLAHEALAFVLGSGHHLGWFVITQMRQSTTASFADGQPIAQEVELALREFADVPAPRSPRAAVAQAAQRLNVQRVTPQVLKPGSAMAAMQQAAHWAAKVQRGLQQAHRIVDKLQNAARAARAGQWGTAVMDVMALERVLEQSRGQARTLAGLSVPPSVPEALHPVLDLARAGAQTVAALDRARAALRGSGAGVGDVASRITAASAHVQQAANAFESARTAAARVAAAVAVRQELAL